MSSTLRKAAVARGVAFLLQQRATDGTWPHRQIGMTALAGLTLLECDIPVDEPGMQQTIAAVRKGSVNANQTYSVALCLLFLDRLGDPDDVPLIESLAVRLLAGQARIGAYGYNCPSISAEEVRRLGNQLNQRTELIGRVKLPARSDKEPEKGTDKAPPRRLVKDLPREIQQQLQLINRVGGPLDRCDNSNTQFATLALWAVRKHGMPVDMALARIDAYFRSTQNIDGTWNYSPGFPKTSAAMTCAGLIGLAVGHGSIAAQIQEKKPNAKSGRDISRDPAVARGLRVLGTAIDHPLARLAKGKGPRAHHLRAEGTGYYFLWSLERLAVAVDLKTIGGKDWYAWGTEVLIDSQLENGSWQGDHGNADTCFGLLFLQRANLVKDLTARLRGKLNDETVMRAGGVGGDSIRVPESPLGKALDPKHTKSPPSGAELAKDTPKAPANVPPKETTRPADPPPELASARLAREFVQAPPAKQEQALQTLREAKGTVYTEALASAIPLLDDAARRKAARDALAERLSRMKDQTLGLYLKDEDAEIRRAAALACVLKDAKTLIPGLIPLLDDPEKDIVRKAALLALKELSGKNLGPAREDWQAWWDKQGK